MKARARARARVRVRVRARDRVWVRVRLRRVPVLAGVEREQRGEQRYLLWDDLELALRDVELSDRLRWHGTARGTYGTPGASKCRACVSTARPGQASLSRRYVWYAGAWCV